MAAACIARRFHRAIDRFRRPVDLTLAFPAVDGDKESDGYNFGYKHNPLTQ